MSAWQAYLEDHRERFLQELLDFLRIPSISSLPEHADDVRRAGEWVVTRLKAAGIEDARILETGGHPVVYGEWRHAEGRPTVMIYGHFDTQPVDPLELWTDPPFEPTVRDGRVYARGAADDKGNMLAPILAVEALLQTQGSLPLNVKFFFEGQEEIGSPQLPEFIAGHQELLACDLVFSADGGQWDEDQPAVLTGLRGVCALQIDVRGADRDVHSGTYGGAFLNPIHALASIIDSMHTPDGRVAVAGFYDAVQPPSQEERARLAALPFDEADYMRQLGLSALSGEPGYSTYERTWIRPTLEVNGIWGGFQGEGTKTVIPSLAHAKISCRLVPDQDPADILTRVTSHVQAHTPEGAEVTVHPFDSTAAPYVVPLEHPGNRTAQAVHRKLYGKEPFAVRMGGSIPVCGLLLKHLGAYTIDFAFGLKDENIHAPDEFFRLQSFEKGQRGYAMLLLEVARQGA